MDSTPTISEADLTRLLPTCQRCRRLRRKCDTQLPACRLCQKGKAECTFFDHALQQTLPRSYVHSLLNRLARLKAVQNTIDGGAFESSATAPIYNDSFANGHARHISTTSVDLQQPHDWQFEPGKVSFDKHFFLEHANPTCWQYFGSSSAYSLAVEVLVVAQARYGKLTHPEKYTGPEFRLNQCVPESLEFHEPRPCPSRDEVEMLVNSYTTTFNVINGYSDNAQIANEIDTYMRNQGSATKFLTGLEAHQFFRVAMICAVASANKSRHQPRYAAEAFDYYREAIQVAEEVTSSISLDALQALLLLVLFVFCYPRRGDMWKLLDYACRLSVELNIHCETNDEYEDKKTQQRRRSIFWGLYSLERTFGQHLGRPSDLPEEIITAEYPASLEPTSVNEPYIQNMLVSHYYRLIYLRSEMFRVLYMPAVAPELPRNWYEDRLEDFTIWRHEVSYILDNPAQEPGMGTMQIEIGFHTSVNFLFQPLILRALAAIKNPETMSSHAMQDSGLVIPHESYEAAVRSIEFYDRIFHAQEDSLEGSYPVTIVSAHYIHQATLTVMAHVLLALDGRLPLVVFSRDIAHLPRTVDQDGTVHVEVPPIDFSNIQQISDACVNLLEHLAVRWEGMVGILDLYREMHEKVLPSLTER